ncbi:hypothetical protein BSKO_04838 [Bryopsis sp. KO-2023]|nr:hypothetical protein BSKO_04838 [Bryopsis sp. KO-2023]
MLSLLIVLTLCYCSEATLSYAAPIVQVGGAVPQNSEIALVPQAWRLAAILGRATRKRRVLGAGQGSIVRLGSCCRQNVGTATD